MRPDDPSPDDASSEAVKGDLPPRIFIGNFDCEERWLRASRSLHDTLKPSRLKGRALRRASLLATTLRGVLDSDHDWIWTPRRLSPDQLPAIEGLCRPRTVSGLLDAIDGPLRPVAWGETAETEKFRARVAAGRPEARPPAPWSRLAQCAHRGSLLALRRELDSAHPGTALITSLPQAQRALEELDRVHSEPSAWVFKGCLSAAGRKRLIGQGRGLTRDEELELRRLLDAQGALLLEPWVERNLDFGVLGRVEEEDVRVESLHQQFLSPRGQVESLVVWPDALCPLSQKMREAIRQAAREVGRGLQALGFRGVYGVDGYVHGENRLHSVCEINPRWTFGRVAQALRARIRAAQGLDEHFAFCLSLAERRPEPPGGPALAWTTQAMTRTPEGDACGPWMQVGEG